MTLVDRERGVVYYAIVAEDRPRLVEGRWDGPFMVRLVKVDGEERLEFLYVEPALTFSVPKDLPE